MITSEPTCTEVGVKTYSCNRCGEEKTEDIPATGHNWDTETTIDKEPTCKKAGQKSIHCLTCGAIKEGSEEAIPALRHKWDDGVVTTEPTCTESGKRTYTCYRCGRTRIAPISSLGHQLTVASAKAATCEEDGNIAYWTCERYGKIFSDEAGAGEISASDTIVPSTGHAWDEGTVTKEATCTQSGEKTYTCTNDPAHKKTETIPATGVHSWSDWAVKTPASAGVKGEEVRTCSVCGTVESRDIAALPVPETENTNGGTGQPETDPNTTPNRPDISNPGATPAAAAAAETNVTHMSENADPAGATIGVLRLKASRISKKFITVSWKPAAGANRYIVYGARCGTKYAKLGIVSGTSFKHKGLLKGKYYKYVVLALAPDGHVVAVSKSIHVATKGGKVGNFTKVIINRKKVS